MNFDETADILFCIEELKQIHYPSNAIMQGLHNYNALINKQSKELEAIYNLVEIHSPVLRNKTVLRYNKLLTRHSSLSPKVPSVLSKENLSFKCLYNTMEESVQDMLKQIEEMPKEWTIVQLTPQYNSTDYLNEDTDLFYTYPLNISVFNCGQNQVKPFLVTVDSPKDPVNGKNVELVQEMISIIKGNKEALTTVNKQKKFRSYLEKSTYFNKRYQVEDRLRGLIKDLQDLWLKEWRCLLTGKYCDENLEKHIQDEIDHYFKSEATEFEVTEKVKAILSAVVKSSLYLKLMEVKKVVQKCFPQVTDKNTIKNIAQFLRNLSEKLIIKGVNTKKHPVILVLHDSLDCFPWELLDVLQDEPVSRLPSLHFVYCLFKEHEKSIVGGNVIITEHEKGSYIVNPDTDLKSMEIRMMSFFQYWMPEWIGTSGYQPDKEEFFELLTSSNIFSYNGHGSGNHLMSLEKIQKSHIKAVILLFGCGSTKLNRMDPQIEMYGSYHAYLIARCPCVVGMLWEVTDTDTDVLTTDFMSYWIPSKAAVHWKYVDKTKWKKAEAELQFVKCNKNNEEGTLWEPELLRALASSKKNLNYLVTKSACVVRGLPVKLQV